MLVLLQDRHVQPHVCIYVYICGRGPTPACMYVYVYICTYMYRYVYICIYIYVYICIYMYVYISTYMYVYICIYMYIYVYTAGGPPRVYTYIWPGSYPGMHVYMWAGAHLGMRVCIYICGRGAHPGMHVCIFMYIHIYMVYVYVAGGHTPGCIYMQLCTSYVHLP